ncbi:hypothetical protein THRCLA_12047, partial [Thraustotheca clavata]
SGSDLTQVAVAAGLPPVQASVVAIAAGSAAGTPAPIVDVIQAAIDNGASLGQAAAIAVAVESGASQSQIVATAIDAGLSPKVAVIVASNVASTVSSSTGSAANQSSETKTVFQTAEAAGASPEQAAELTVAVQTGASDAQVAQIAIDNGASLGKAATIAAALSSFAPAVTADPTSLVNSPQQVIQAGENAGIPPETAAEMAIALAQGASKDTVSQIAVNAGVSSSTANSVIAEVQTAAPVTEATNVIPNYLQPTK